MCNVDSSKSKSKGCKAAAPAWHCFPCGKADLLLAPIYHVLGRQAVNDYFDFGVEDLVCADALEDVHIAIPLFLETDSQM